MNAVPHEIPVPPTVRVEHRRGRLKIGAVAFALFRGFSPTPDDFDERGGFLVGRIIKGTCDLVVDTVTPPMRGDVGGPTDFYLHAPRHQPVLDAFHHDSDGRRYVLGTWHTHNEDDPTPSDIDERGELERLARGEYGDGEGDEAPGFVVIVGRKVIGVWEVTKDGLRLCGKAPLP